MRIVLQKPRRLLWPVSALLLLLGLVALFAVRGEFGGGLAAGMAFGCAALIVGALKGVSGNRFAVSVAGVAGFMLLDVLLVLRGVSGRVQEVLLALVVAAVTASAISRLN